MNTEQKASLKVPCTCRKRKMALCLACDGDLDALDRQIMFFMHQPYEHFHFFAAVKGIAENVFATLEERYTPWIDKGMLTLRHFPRKNQVSNFIDTVRDLDRKGFDLFLYIEQNDIYPVDYLEITNNFHSIVPQNFSGYYQGTFLVKRLQDGFGRYMPESLTGAFSLKPEAMEKLLQCEQEPSLISTLFKDNQDPANGNYGQDTIELIRKIISHMGCRNMEEYVRGRHKGHFLYRNTCGPDTGGGVPGNMFRETNRKISIDPARHEHILELHHDAWSDGIRLMGNRCQRMCGGSSNAASVSLFTEQEIVIDWDQYGVERFVKNKAGIYCFDEEFTLLRQAGKVARRNRKGSPPNWGVCAVALPRESYYWLQDWVDHHIRAGAALIVIYDNTGSTASLRNTSAFLNGHFQKSGTSKRGEQYGKLTAHLSDADIRKLLDRIVDQYGHDKVKVETWQPRHPNTGEIIHGQVEAYEDFIRQYGELVDWCAFIDLDEYIYCRPGLSVDGILKQVEKELPSISMLRMDGWLFEQRWNSTGPNDISSHVKHLPLKDGDIKNFLKLCDVTHGDIHLFWGLSKGHSHVKAHPEDLAFCHYNRRPEDMGEAIELISPRAFLNTPILPQLKMRLK